MAWSTSSPRLIAVVDASDGGRVISVAGPTLNQRPPVTLRRSATPHLSRLPEERLSTPVGCDCPPSARVGQHQDSCQRCLARQPNVRRQPCGATRAFDREGSQRALDDASSDLTSTTKSARSAACQARTSIEPRSPKSLKVTSTLHFPAQVAEHATRLQPTNVAWCSVQEPIHLRRRGRSLKGRTARRGRLETTVRRRATGNRQARPCSRPDDLPATYPRCTWRGRPASGALPDARGDKSSDVARS